MPISYGMSYSTAVVDPTAVGMTNVSYPVEICGDGTTWTDSDKDVQSIIAYFYKRN